MPSRYDIAQTYSRELVGPVEFRLACLAISVVQKKAYRFVSLMEGRRRFRGSSTGDFGGSPKSDTTGTYSGEGLIGHPARVSS